jgi:(E)-4-hydroxy-3-methylbut-2-enyl-diphosphate synthase
MRRKTHTVQIGDLPLGSDYPVRVQSMTNTDTMDTESTVAQCIRIIEAGGEYVRITAQGVREAEQLAVIKNTLHRRGYRNPLIADIHFNPKAAETAARIVEKVRINPGNYADKKLNTPKTYTDDEYAAELERIHGRILPLLRICKEYGTVIRIGSNHGSLSDRIVNRYGNSPQGMVESAMEFLRIFEAENFRNVVLSMKASNLRVVIDSTRLLAERMAQENLHYPLHLGVTEAGEGEDGRIKSAVGIGTLLMDGIGDTIRVSLTEPPEAEIPAAYGILQACRLRISKAEYISCPSCGRTQFDLQTTAARIRERTSHLTGLKIGIMGCIVNGPGEMADADYGYVGAAPGKITLYRRREVVKRNIPEEQAVEELISLMKANGDWKENSSTN